LEINTFKYKEIEENFEQDFGTKEELDAGDFSSG
jgi:hypothetical protein